MKLYKVKGNVSGIGSRGEDMQIIVGNVFDENQAPVLLKVCGNLKDYINELSYGDSEEKYARKVFYYDWMCTLVEIDVLDKNGKVVKMVVGSWIDHDYRLRG